MTAYELADFIDKYCEDNTSKEAAVLLRQQAGELEYYKVRDSSHIKIIKEQADRIAELEKFNKAILKKGGYPYEKSNPVAWMSPDGKVSTTEGILFHIPLYTTPQTKPLSDEEIMQISHQALENSALIPKNNFMIAFARAIEERHGIK